MQTGANEIFVLPKVTGHCQCGASCRASSFGKFFDGHACFLNQTTGNSGVSNVWVNNAQVRSQSF